MQVIDPNNEVGTVGIQGAIDSYDVEDFGGCDDINDSVSIGESNQLVAGDDVAVSTNQPVADKVSSQIPVSLPNCRYRTNT